MPVKVLGSTDKQSVEIVIGTSDSEGPCGTSKTVVFKFERDKVDQAEMSFDGKNWISALEAKVAIQAFAEKYPTFATEE